MRWSPCLLVLVFLLVSGCASEQRSEGGWGWFAAPAAFSMASDGADWGFSTEGSDLHLRNHSRHVVLAGYVPKDGVRYRILDDEDPHIEFRSTDEVDADWEGDAVTFRGETLALVE